MSQIEHTKTIWSWQLYLCRHDVEQHTNSHGWKKQHAFSNRKSHSLCTCMWMHKCDVHMGSNIVEKRSKKLKNNNAVISARQQQQRYDSMLIAHCTVCRNTTTLKLSACDVKRVILCDHVGNLFGGQTEITPAWELLMHPPRSLNNTSLETGCKQKQISYV